MAQRVLPPAGSALGRTGELLAGTLVALVLRRLWRRGRPVDSTSRPPAGTCSPNAICDTGTPAAGAGRTKCSWAARSIRQCPDGGRAAETGGWGAPARWGGRGGARGGAEGGPSRDRARPEGRLREALAEEGGRNPGEHKRVEALGASPGGTRRLVHDSCARCSPRRCTHATELTPRVRGPPCDFQHLRQPLGTSSWCQNNVRPCRLSFGEPTPMRNLP